MTEARFSSRSIKDVLVSQPHAGENAVRRVLLLHVRQNVDDAVKARICGFQSLAL